MLVVAVVSGEGEKKMSKRWLGLSQLELTWHQFQLRTLYWYLFSKVQWRKWHNQIREKSARDRIEGKGRWGFKYVFWGHYPKSGVSRSRLFCRFPSFKMARTLNRTLFSVFRSFVIPKCNVQFESSINVRLI